MLISDEARKDFKKMFETVVLIILSVLDNLTLAVAIIHRYSVKDMRDTLHKSYSFKKSFGELAVYRALINLKYKVDVWLIYLSGSGNVARSI